MAIYKQSSLIWNYTPSSDVRGGDVVLLGPNSDIVAVVVSDIEGGKTGTVNVSGAVIFDTSDSFDVGENAYYNSTSGKITDDNSDIYAGKIMEQITSTSVLVDLVHPSSTSDEQTASVILSLDGTDAPSGYVITGNDLNRTTYAGLFGVLGEKFGSGDGSTTFGTPPQADIATSPTLLATGLSTSVSVTGCDVDSDNGVYLGQYGVGIHYRTEAGVISSVIEAVKNWYGICVAPNGDVYASVNSEDIYLRTAGAGDFNALSQTSRNWTNMAADSSGNIYAAVTSGDIYLRTAGAGDFEALGQTSRAWTGICVAPNGDVYATESATNKVYLRTAGAGDFEELQEFSFSGNLSGIESDIEGNIYLLTNQQRVFIRYGGTGEFINAAVFDPYAALWTDMCFDSNNNGYITSSSGAYYAGLWSYKRNYNTYIKY